jgi:hypothetical protein
MNNLYTMRGSQDAVSMLKIFVIAASSEAK